MTKATKTTRGPTTYVSKFAPGFMIQMNFAFFNVKSICGFNSTFVAICSATSHTFGLPYRSKIPHINILKLIVTTLRNQDKKAAFIRVDEDGALEKSNEFMKICYNMSITVQTTGGYASSLNGKIESPNKKIANITRAILLKSSHKK